MIIQQCLNKGCRRPPGPIGFCDHHLRLRKEAKAQIVVPRREFHNSDFLYLISADKSDAIKVGKSLDPVMRLLELQAPIPFDLRLSAAFCVVSDDARRLELLMHKALTKRGLLIRGEWFRIGVDEAISTVEAVARKNEITIMTPTAALEACREEAAGPAVFGREAFDAKLARLIRTCAGY